MVNNKKFQQVEINTDLAMDIEQILNGGFSPLTTFLDKESLEGISESTNGGYVPWSEKLNLIDQLSIKSRKEVFSQTVDLSHWPPFLILLVVFLAAEWALRRSRGLQ